jgi:hypothetical protein
MKNQKCELETPPGVCGLKMFFWGRSDAYGLGWSVVMAFLASPVVRGEQDICEGI